MSISIQLTDEQAKQLAADIIKLNKPDEPAPLPEPPEGFHKAIRGPLKVCSKMSFDPDVFQYCRDGQWQPYANGWDSTPYALRIGSEIAKLNGLEPEAKPDTARREWGLQGHSFLDANVVVKGPLLECDMTCVTVREVLPGDPTPEQVQALVDACWEWRDVPHHEDIRKALAPFRKP